MKIPNFKTRKELFDFLIENKSRIIAAKKDVVKHADGVAFIGNGNGTKKAASESGELEVKAIINTTNIMDSHKDVHIQGLWKKSLSENKNIMHLQEHQMEFEKIIADGDDLKAYTKVFTFKELGYKIEGTTEALVFESTIKLGRQENNYMYKQYKNGRVKNHSVGMRYVKMALAINSEDYPEELSAWEKYFPQVANASEAEEIGYFWAVTEAKVIEGSAVPMGSNTVTPTLEVKEPVGTPPLEPLTTTPKKSSNLIQFLS